MDHPVIFLDFGGVLEPHLKPDHLSPVIDDLNIRLADELGEPELKNINNSIVNIVYRDFDPVCFAFLEKLIREFHAEIVVTSSWRIFHSLSELKALMKIQKIEPVIAKLPSGSIRSDLIRSYLRHHPGVKYIILDDMNLSKPFGNHFIHCPNGFYLTEFEKARSALRFQS